MIREVPRIAEVSQLTPRQIDLLTQLIFIPESSPAALNCLVVFGNTDATRIAQKTTEVVAFANPSDVILTGGAPTFDDYIACRKYSSEAEEIFHRIPTADFSQTTWHIETNSRNTLENAKFATDALNLTEPQSLGLVCISLIRLRAKLSLQSFTFQNHIEVYSFDKLDPETNEVSSQDNWMNHPLGQSRIFGEYLRLKKYGERGDFYYPEEVRSLVNEINLPPSSSS